MFGHFCCDCVVLTLHCAVYTVYYHGLLGVDWIMMTRFLPINSMIYSMLAVLAAKIAFL